MDPTDKKNNIYFRFATTADAEAIAELATTTFFETFAPANTKEDMFRYCSRAFSKEQTEKELTEEGSVFILVHSEQDLVGYARLHTGTLPDQLKTSKAIGIERLYILQACTRQGIGSLLMQECLNLAAQLGYNTVWLGVWEHNKNAIAFYNMWDFRPVGFQPFILGSDVQTDLVMARNISVS